MTGRRHMARLFAALLLMAATGSRADAQPIDASGSFHQRMGTGRLSAVALSVVEPRYRWLVDLGYAYARAPLMATNTGLVGTRNLVADQHSAELQLVLGLPYVQVGLAMPLVLYQAGEPWTDSAGQDHDGVHWFGVGDLRLHVKVMLLDPRRFGVGLALAADLATPTGQGHHFTGSPTVVFRPRLVLDYWVKRIAYLSLNLAYVQRSAERLEELVIDDQLEMSFGVMVKFGVLGRPFFIFGEIVAATQVSDPFGVEGGTPVEGRFGIRLWNNDNFFAEISWGAALRRADGLPRYRAMVNLGLTFLMPGMSRGKMKPADRDGDGVPDATDRCPDQPEDLDGFEDSDGCPEEGKSELTPADKKKYRKPPPPRWWQKWRKRRARAKAKRAAREAKKRRAARRKSTGDSELSRAAKRLKERSKRLSRTIKKASDRIKKRSERLKKAARDLGKKLKRARPRPRPKSREKPPSRPR